MTTEEKRLNEIIRREGLADEIKESIKYFKDTLPLSFERKALFAKAAMQLKSKNDIDKKHADSVVDEINALIPKLTGKGGKKVYNSTRDFIGNRYGVFKVVGIVDDTLPPEKAFVFLQCERCESIKKYGLKYVRGHSYALRCPACGAR